MKILVTGGSGFIGSNFIRFWFGQHPKDTIINLDAMTYAARPAHLEQFLHEVKPIGVGEYRFERVDITNRWAVSKAMQRHKPDHVFHFAAESHVCRSILGPEAFVHTNVVGTFNLLEEFRELHKLSPEGHRFVHISTDEVFGELPLDKFDMLGEEIPLFSETTPIAPRSPYAASKASSDLLAKCYAETYGLHTIIMNCSNNFGPNQHSEKLIPRTIQLILEGKAMTVYGKGNQVRDWLWVFDNCKAIGMAFLTGKPGERFCVGGRKELTNLEVIQAVFEAVKKYVPEAKLDLSFTTDRPTDDLRYAINCSKLESTGWKASTEEFERNLERTVLWYLNNEDWGKRWKTSVGFNSGMKSQFG